MENIILNHKGKFNKKRLSHYNEKDICIRYS